MRSSEEPESRRHDLTGLTIGRFTITGRVGSGGMGEVYRAEDTQLKRTVAIKRVAARVQDPRHYKDELLKEAQRASALNHPRIAGIYDILADGDELFLVMEYIDGSTLRQRMESAIALSDFWSIALQCTEGLAAAHEKGILHGDLKPANIMITRDKGEVKVCDFGLSRRVKHEASPTTTVSTIRADFGGTPAYIAPELILDRSVDLRADIFSLGVVFYEMLSGRNPFLNDNVLTTLDLVRNHSPERLDRINPNVPAKLATLVHRMIEKDPANRYATAGAVLDDLVAIKAESNAAPPRLIRFKRFAVAVISLVLVIIAIVQLRIWRINAPSSESMPAEINLAVLPFQVFGAGPDKKFFSQGLTDTLTAHLARLTINRKFQVASTTETRTRSVLNPKDARDQLGANVALSGNLEYSGDTVRIACVVIDTRTGRAIRTETVTAAASNPLAVEETIIAAVVRMLNLHLESSERAALSGHETQQPSAYDFQLQARGYLLNYDRVENLDNAIAVFRKALEIDKRYALAYAGLGESYWRKHELTSSPVWVEPARAACEGALAIDPELAESHACLGMVLTGTGDYEKAADEFRVAINREPTNDSFYSGLATAYEKLGRSADAEQTYRQAIALRPHYWASYNALGAYYYRTGKYDDALAMFKEVVALAPDSFRGYSSMGAMYFLKDQIPEATSAYKKSLAIRPNYPAASNLGTLYYSEGDYTGSADAFRQALLLQQNDYQVWANLAAALEWIPEPRQAAEAYTRARELAEERLHVNPRNAAVQLSVADYSAAVGEREKARTYFAEVLAAAPSDYRTQFRIAIYFERRLRQRDDALSWLSEAIKHGQTWREVDREPALRELRKDPRFQKLRHGS